MPSSLHNHLQEDDSVLSNESRGASRPSTAQAQRPGEKGWGARASARDPWQTPLTPEERRARRRRERSNRLKRKLVAVGALVVMGSGAAYALHSKRPAVPALDPAPLNTTSMKVGGEAAAADDFELQLGAQHWPELAAVLSSHGVVAEGQQAQGSQLTLQLKAPANQAGVPAQADFRRLASSLEELEASGSDLPANLPQPVDQQLSQAHVNLVRLPGDYQLERGDQRYSSAEGFTEPAGSPRQSLIAGQSKANLNQNSLSLKLGSTSLQSLTSALTDGSLEASPDLQSCTVDYDYSHHRGTIWLHGAKPGNEPAKGAEGERIWSQLPDSTTCVVGETSFLDSLFSLRDPVLRRSLVARLWTGHEGWQGFAVQAGLSNFARLSGWVHHSQLALAWAGQTNPKSSLTEGKHGNWTVSRPGDGLASVRSGFEESTPSSPSPLAMWRSKELPSAPRAMGRFNLNSPDSNKTSETTISWIAGGNSKATWIWFQDQAAPAQPGNANVPSLDPETKSVHRIHPTIIAGQ